MIKEAMKGQALLAVAAAVAFCGATLYAADKALNRLFKDVEPDKIEASLKETKEKIKAAEAEKAAPAKAAEKVVPVRSSEAAEPKAADKPETKPADKEEPMIEVYCYDRCNTCKKALEWLDEHGVKYDTIDIQKNNPSRSKLKKYHKMSGLPLKKFFNTSGKAYREMGLAGKLKDMPQDEQLMILASDGMLVKRPLLVGDDFVLVGFKEEEWQEKLG